MIPGVPAITRFARVPVPHTNDATYALDAEGNDWVAKREAEMGCEALLAEAVTWLLAREIGVCTPDAAFCDDAGERAWLSRRVPDANHWSAASLVAREPRTDLLLSALAGRCARAELLTGGYARLLEARQ